ncbi:MAG: SpoIVB peptidase S55 domain-containing protein [Armatimonadota bacterium]|nr:SpoIVB peptidase S55 domain-containing protein [Armatimonadota bacterium]
MTRVWRAVMVCGLALAVLLPPAAVGSAQEGLPPIMKVAEIKPGMRGVGRTTVKSPQIAEFNFEVMALLAGGGGAIPVKHLILYRTYGPLMEQTGGTAAGMSGSPLYINGKLVGAHSASYLFQTRKDLGLGTVFSPTTPLVVDGKPVHRVVVARTPAQARQAAALPGTLAFLPTQPVALAGGLTPRAFTLLQKVMGERLAQRPLVQYGGGQAAGEAAQIRAGSPVGILQVLGDVEFGGICTTTLRVGSKLLICGHPWENLGSVAYGLTTAEIVTVVQTLQRPFLEGNLGPLVGQIDEDRGPGIRGLVGKFPRMFTVRVTVNDADSGKTVSRAAQVVRRADLVRLFAPLVAFVAAERGRDQVQGEGSARVKMAVRARRLPGVISRENIFYSQQDVALASVLDISTAVQFLFFNPFADLDPFDLKVEMTLSRKRETAEITNVEAETREVDPGGTIRVRITVRPYQQDQQVSRVIEVPVPRNYPRGPAVLLVSSAGIDLTGTSPEDVIVRDLLTEQPPFPGDTLEEAVEIFESLGTNNQILIRLVPFGLPATGAEFTKFDVFAGRLIRTNWVIQGEFRVPIHVR